MTKKCIIAFILSFVPMAIAMEDTFCADKGLSDVQIENSYVSMPEDRTMVRGMSLNPEGTKMRKIIIFTSGGGGGHLSASNALQSYFEDEFNVTQVSVFSEAFGAYDPLAVVTRGQVSEESFYNALIKRQQFGLFNKVCGLARTFYNWCDSSMIKTAEDFLCAHDAHLVISVAPLANHAIAQACSQLCIPFVLIPTDTDTGLFTYNMGATNDMLKYMINIPFMYDPVMSEMQKDGVDMEHVVSYGFPLRKDFYECKDVVALKEQYNIPENRPIILVTMGAQGSTGAIRILKSLSKLTKCAHVVLILGNSYHELMPIIDAYLKQNKVPHVSVECIERTSRMSDYMAMADVIVGKSGGATVCEAIQMQCPLFLDATKTPVIWEQMNHRFIQENHLGFIVKDFDDLAMQIVAYLDNAPLQRQVKESLARLVHYDTPEQIRQMCLQLL